MTSKFKCPFCQQELREIYFNGVGVGYICPNPNCKKAEKLKGNVEFWQALIQAKQDLDFFIKEQVRTQTALIERTKELDKCQKDLEESQQATLENAQTVLEIHKDLDIATKALDWIGNNRLAENPVRVEQLRRHARNALEQINRKEI